MESMQCSISLAAPWSQVILNSQGWPTLQWLLQKVSIDIYCTGHKKFGCSYRLFFIYRIKAVGNVQ
jgi:hypothetical protein